MSTETLINLCVLLPFIGAVALPVFHNRPNIREAVTLTVAGLLFLMVSTVGMGVADGARPVSTPLELMPGLTVGFKIEPLGFLFSMIASFLWIVTTVYAIGYMRGHDEKNQTRFYVCFAIAIGSAMGIAFASNLLTLFIFYEILTFSTFPLVAHAQTEEAKKGSRTYLVILVGTSVVFQMPAIIWVWYLTGTLDFTPGGILKGQVPAEIAGPLLILFVFGIGKAALMPFHRWLPAAMVAPTPVSALLHAVAVVKAGVFSVLKVTYFVFGLELVRSLTASQFLMWVAATTILLASLIAMRQDNLKRRLAYSTVSQLSYIVLAAMLATSTSMIGGGMHILMHAFGKITLFFCAGAILVAAHKTEISQLSGIGRRMPWTMGAFLVGSISIIGLPPFGGVWSKWLIGTGALDAGHQVMIGVLAISTLLNIAYLIPIPIRAFFGKELLHHQHEGHGDGHHHHVHGEAPWPILVAQTTTAVGCLILFLFPQPVFDLLASLVGY